MMQKHYVFTFTQAPYKTSLAREALDMALACAAFDQDVTLIFMNDGIFQLMSEQLTPKNSLKNFAKTYDALDLYDIDKIFVDETSLHSRGLSSENLKGCAQIKSAEDIQSALDQADIIMSF